MTRNTSEYLTKFSILINEPKLLLTLAKECSDTSYYEPLLKSAIILSFAYWERFVEDLLWEGCLYIAEGLRDPNDLPLKTQEKIACASINENREKNSMEFTKSVWSFAGDGWSEQYKKYAKKRIESINTPSIQNIQEAYFDVFGIRKIFDGLSASTPNNEELINLFNAFIEKRHKLAHGDSNALCNVECGDIENWIKVELEFVRHLEHMTWKQIDKITQKSAKEYSLRSMYIKQIIEYFKAQGRSCVTNEVFQKMSTTANSNYKKLGYEPWALLEIRTPKCINPTNRMFDFIDGRLTLPARIVVLKNQLAFPKENTDFISFEDLLKEN